MQTSVIRHRVADFLKQYPPFDAISEHDLLEAAGSGRVKFHQAGEYVFRQGQEKGKFVWVVQQGRVDSIEERAVGEQLRDVVGEGDLLGLDRFLGNGSCLYSARTGSDVILYGVSAEMFESLVQQYPAVKRYLRAHFSISTLSGSRRTSWLDAEVPPGEFFRARLVGTVTGGDLSMRSCSAVVAAPVTTRAAVRVMLSTRNDALAITSDGTLESAIEGILTADELALFSGHNPLRLIDAIRNAASPEEMRPFLKRAKRVVLDALAEPADVDDCARIGTEIAAALAEACLKQAHIEVLRSGVAPPAEPWCWFLFGAAARREMLETEFPAIAVIYDDLSGAEYFEAMGCASVAWLTACGFTTSEPIQAKPLSAWKHLYSETIQNPLEHDLYACRDLFDLASLTGEIALLDAVRNEVRQQLDEQRIVIALLANDTLAHLPPLTFFRGLVLELDGEQHSTVDIDTTAILPIADAARVFAMATGRLTPANTLERLQNATLDFPDGTAILAGAAEAFRIGHYYRAVSGSSTIAPSQLGKFDQRLLKTAFSSIQRLLEFTAATFFRA